MVWFSLQALFFRCILLGNWSWLSDCHLPLEEPHNLCHIGAQKEHSLCKKQPCNSWKRSNVRVINHSLCYIKTYRMRLWEAMSGVFSLRYHQRDNTNMKSKHRKSHFEPFQNIRIHGQKSIRFLLDIMYMRTTNIQPLSDIHFGGVHSVNNPS